MKNIFVWYIAILLPLGAIIFWLRIASNPWWPLAALIIYGSLYRPLTDGYRLYKKGIIKKKDIRKMFIPMPFGNMRLDNFRDLYFKR